MGVKFNKRIIKISMREVNGPSPAEMGIKPNLIEQDAPKTEAEAEENKRNRETMNTLFMADRDGKNIPDLLASDTKLEKSVKEILASDEYNPERLSMEQIQGQSARKSTPGERGTENKWKNMIQLPDGRSVANPFAVAAGLGRKTEQQGAQNREPVVKPVVETGETPVKETGEPTRPGAGGETGGDTGAAERARAEAETAKAERDAAQAAEDAQKIDQLTDMWMANDPNARPEASSQTDKIHRGGVVLGESGVVGQNAGDLGRAIDAANADGAETIVHDMAADKPASIADRVKGGWKKLFGGKEVFVPTEQPINMETGENPLVDTWMANKPDDVPYINLSADSKNKTGPGDFVSKRRETRAGGETTVSLPTNARLRPVAGRPEGVSEKPQAETEGDENIPTKQAA